MLQFYFTKRSSLKSLTAIIMMMAVSFLISTGCTQKINRGTESEEENDKYDSPGKAAEYEYNRTKNPSTGKVDRQKMWDAVMQTEQLKAQVRNSPNNLTALTWTERGSYTDAVGPSNGNTRPGNGVTSGRIRAIWVDKADATGKTVWIGGVDGGLWKTTDITAAPATWTVVNDFLSNLSISGICQDPTNSNIMYFCTGEAFFNGDAVFGNGVFKSVDHGVTWAQLGSTTTLTRCSKILCDAAGNVYVSTIGISAAVGLQRSTDGGNSWTSINPFVTSRVTDFEISSTGTMHICAGLFSAAANTGYRYTTNPATVTAATWTTPVTPFIVPSGTGAGGTRTELACVGNTVYAALAHTNAGNTTSYIDSVSKSTDGGANWVTTGLTQTNINDLNGTSGGQGWYAIGLGVDPSNPNNVMVGSLNILKSTDGGLTFSKISEWVGNSGQYVHADQHNITWYDNGNKLLIGCDGGIHYSPDKGITFSDRNTNLRIKQFYSVAIHPTLTNYFIAGAQDNGTHQLNGAGLTSSIEVTGGDGAYVGIDQDEPQFQAAAYVNSNFRRSSNTGANWSYGPSNNTGPFINPFDYDNLNNRIYASFSAGNFLRWEDPHTGFTYTTVPIASFNGSTASAVTSSPYTSNRVYFGTAGGRVVQVDNANAGSPTEANITPAGMTGNVNSVVIGNSDQNLIATITSTGATVNNVWSSTNGGTSWTQCDGNLPDISVYWALYNPDNNGSVYIATETGVWSTDELNGAGTVWVPDPGFPTVKTVMLKYRSSDRLVAAATHGRGIWTANLPSNCTSASITSQPSASTICTGSNTSFSIVAAGTAPLTYQWQVSTTGCGGSFTNISNAGVYTNATTATLNITGATAVMNGYAYQCVVTGNCAPLTATSNCVLLTVNAATAISGQPANSTICAGNNTTFSVAATGTTLSYQWQESINGGGSWNNITNGGIYSGATSATLTLTGVIIGMNAYQYRCVVTGTCAPLNVNSNAGILTVNAATSISGQPGNSTICAGANTTFSVTATGTTLTYQWQLSTNGGGSWNNLSNGAPYSGVSTSTLTITGASAAINTYQYRCVVSSTCSSPLNSNAGTLTVNTGPAITGQPSNVTVCSGNNVSFSVTATGGGLTYQWQESTNGGGSWNNLVNGATYSGVTTATLTITPATAGMDTYQYRCVVSGACPSPVNSNAAVLSVGAALNITSQPANSTVCAGTNTSFTIATSGAVISYQWQESINGGGSWNNITNGGIYGGATTVTLTLTGVTAGMNSYQYRCVVTGSCPSINSNAGILTVTTAPAVTSQPSNSTICATQNTSFATTATGTGLTYQWQVSIPGCAGPWNNLANGAPYSGVTTPTLTITAASTAINGYGYRCIVTGCAPAATSNCGLLTVNAPVGINTQPVNVIACAGANATFSLVATGTSPAYQWQESTNGGGSWNNVTNGGAYGGATTATLTLTGVTAGMNNYQYRCNVSGAAPCGPLTSGSGTLTVNTTPAISSQPSASTICATQNTIFTITATGTGLTYQWQVSTTGCAGTFNDIINGAPYSGVTTPTLTITGASTAINGYGYRCVVTGTCAPSANSNCGLLTVNTAIGISSQPGNAVACAGANATFSVAATGTSPTYQWQESTNGGGSWNNVTNGGIYGGATTATLTLTGVTAAMNNNQYRCNVSGAAPCGALTSGSGILTVNTAPVINTQPSASTICATQNTTFSVSAAGTAITYQWQVSTTGCAGTFNDITNGAPYSGATTATLTITAAANTLNGNAYRCVVSGTCAPSANSNCVLLTVNTPVSISTQPVNTTFCAGATATFNVVAAGTSPAYQWQESTDGGGTFNTIANGGIYSGATSATLTLTGITAGMNGYVYRCSITGTSPCGSLNSGNGILTVNTAPAIITQPVASTTLCVAGTANYSVAANGTALTYQWQVSTDGGTVYSNLANGGVYSNVTTATMTITGATAVMSGYKYRCIVSGTCAPAANSNVGTLTVNLPVTITAPANGTICATGTISFSATVAGTLPVNPYQWQESTNGGVSWNNIANSGVYSGATTTTLTLTGVTTGMNNNQYRIAVTGAVPCGVVNSGSATLTVSAQPSVTLTASPYTRLFPGYTTVISASVNPPTGFSTVWTLNGSPINPANNTYTVDVNHLGVYTVVATIGSCISVPASITIADSVSNKLWIFPSPNNGQFTISYYNPGGGVTTQQVNIYDGMGRRAYTNIVTVTQLYQLIKVDMRRNSAGVYRVVMRDSSGKKVKTGTVEIR